MKFERDDNNYHPLNGQPLVGEDGLKYSEMPEGFISFGDVSRNILQQQCQYGSMYIDGVVRGYPKLGGGLRFNGGEGGNYHSIGIHPEDIEEFVRRMYAYQAYEHGSITDDSGNVYILSDADTLTLHTYLEEIGAFNVPWATPTSA